MESAYIVEGPGRSAPLPRGATSYPAPEKRLLANLSLMAIPPQAHTVPCWYYSVSASDDALERQLAAQGLDEAEIIQRAVLFTLTGPDAFALGREADRMAIERGWRPVGRSPQHPTRDGLGWRPFSECRSRPRPRPPVPYHAVQQHLEAIRTKTFSGEAPGWMFAWDQEGRPHRPCGQVAGFRSLAVGESCGPNKTSGCTLSGGGACAWARQNLSPEAASRPSATVRPDDAPMAPAPPKPPVGPQLPPPAAVYAQPVPGSRPVQSPAHAPTQGQPRNTWTPVAYPPPHQQRPVADPYRLPHGTNGSRAAPSFSAATTAAPPPRFDPAPPVAAPPVAAPPVAAPPVAPVASAPGWPDPPVQGEPEPELQPVQPTPPLTW